MSDQRQNGISWTDETWNPVRGCTRVSEGCRNCYAEAMAARFSGPGQPYEGLAKRTHAGGRWTGNVRLIDGHLTDPLRWRRPRRIFVNSMSDLFHESLADAEIDRVFAVMALAPQHTFQVLTKRPERMREYIGGIRSTAPYLGRLPLERIHIAATGHMVGDGGFMDVLKQHGNVYSLYCSVPWPLPNVWLGVSVEDAAAKGRIDALRETPAALRFLSCEPLIGPLRDIDLTGIGWVICGGESGPHARPMHPEWAQHLRDQCAAAGVPFHFKQWGEWSEVGPTWGASSPSAAELDVCIHLSMTGICYAERGKAWPRAWAMRRVGKRSAGRLLDGVLHDAIPEVKP